MDAANTKNAKEIIFKSKPSMGTEMRSYAGGLDGCIVGNTQAWEK